MLQINMIRQNKEEVKERLARKNFADLHLVDEIVALDEERRRLTFEFDEIKSKINAASKEIGQLMSTGKRDVADDRRKQVEEWKQQLGPVQYQLNEKENQLHATLLRLPNLPAGEVPEGKTPEDNQVLRTGGSMPQFTFKPLPHWELAKKYDLIDFELGNKITGSGFPVYKNRGARLQRAMVHYFLEYNTAAGYTEYMPPHVVNEESAFGTGQLPDKEGQMYYVSEDKLYMIPTAEVPVTNIYRNTILKDADLPVKMTAYTPCFRREAGSYGKDVRGLNRLHQFDKVEIVQLVQPEGSYEAFSEMVQHVEKLVQSLGLHYRILRLCGGDMGFASALTYDFEVYSAAQEKWLEVSSVSNFETFQTNRMKIRYKDVAGKTNLVHSLNGSSLALPRILACLLENYQTANGILLPPVLQSFFGSEMI
ncbi:MAG TPA: serine--tRNA ligase [Chitinophagaceae bacterium]|nr:serine--tRNA ligase [Chitinophagaceae bacterium]